MCNCVAITKNPCMICGKQMVPDSVRLGNSFRTLKVCGVCADRYDLRGKNYPYDSRTDKILQMYGVFDY